jgi:hypothetical protein
MAKKITISWEAEQIARQISGTWDWQGIRAVQGPAGLVAEIQAYLNTAPKTRDCGMFAIEDQQNEEQSNYSVCWDKAGARQANKENQARYLAWAAGAEERREARRNKFAEMYGI